MTGTIAAVSRRAHRFAAGIPLKVVEAVAAGIPAVITPLLSQQLGWSGGDPLPTAESPEQFAAEVAGS
jgi:hypothetical protein